MPRIARPPAAYPVGRGGEGVVYSKKELVVVFLVAVLAGSGLHFLYSTLPCPVTALFAPVNESLWEHVKLVVWPFLAAGLFLSRGRPGGALPWLSLIPWLSLGMLLVAWVIHITLERQALWLDIVLYLGVMVVGFWGAPRFSGPFRGARWKLAAGLALVFLVLTWWYTFFPPEGRLFLPLG